MPQQPCLGALHACPGRDRALGTRWGHTQHPTAACPGHGECQPQQEGRTDSCDENPPHPTTGYSFVYMIPLSPVTNNWEACYTPRAINNFSPGAIF